LLFSPTRTGINNLIREGFKAHNKPIYTADNPGIFHCGDIMYDNSLHFAEIAEDKSNILEKYNLQKGDFILGTIHRNNNTDEPERLSAIFEAIHEISSTQNLDIVLPLHPRTSKILQQNLDSELYDSIQNNPNIKIIPPASFFEIITLEKNCKLVMTDSGGVQKEAYYFEKPVIILRPETEWVEIVENGVGKITDANKENILNAFTYFESKQDLSYPPVFGDGKAAEFICGKLI
jgi:UDP-GlcNAc3NAcA epimerase